MRHEYRGVPEGIYDAGTAGSLMLGSFHRLYTTVVVETTPRVPAVTAIEPTSVISTIRPVAVENQ
jgi:hypothetical protein